MKDKKKIRSPFPAPEKKDEFYDTVIVGAGLSGLAAAYELRKSKAIILEKNGYPGGRVRTCIHKGIVYELGALFAFNKEAMPFDFESSPLIHENGPIGIYHKGKIRYGRSCLECMLKANLTLGQIKELITANNYRFLAIEPVAILNTFFQVIHPGKILDAVRQRRQDALVKFETHHFEQGNREIVSAFLKNANSLLKLNARVVSIADERDHVQIVYRKGSRLKKIFSKTAILSSPAPVVGKIVQKISKKCLEFINSLGYGEGMVTALGIRDVDFHDFSYIVTPGLALNTIFKQRTSNSHSKVISAYFVGKEAVKLQSVPKPQVVSRAVDAIRQIQPYRGRFSDNNIVFSDVHHWNAVGPIISKKSYGNWTTECARPSDRVFLCGDYQHVDHENLLPYGMTAAVLSGRKAGNWVKQFLND